MVYIHDLPEDFKIVVFRFLIIIFLNMILGNSAGYWGFNDRKLSPFKLFIKAYRAEPLLKEYVNTTNIHGYKRTNKNSHSKIDRILWIILMIVIIFTTSWLIINSYIVFLFAPTATTQEPVRTSISEIPFPAVAICSGSRLSRINLLEMSERILKHQRNTVNKLGNNISEIFSNLLLFGSFYDLIVDENSFYEIDKLHSILTEIYNGAYPINEMMANLSVPCSKLLIRCKLFNKHVNCEDIFQTRKTYLGQCCVFNYKRPEINYIDKTKYKMLPKPNYLYVNGSGLRNGLSVLIDQSLEDMSYKILNSITAKVLIFDTMDYPDFMSSAVTEKYIRVNRDSTITINPVVVEADASMKYFPPTARKCLFPEESNLVLKTHYSFSECLLNCRIKDMLDFCGCIPPYMTLPLMEGSYCLFKDIPCLARWRDKWFNFEPLISNSKNVQKFLQCPECLTGCHYIKYKLQNSWLEINPPPSPHGIYVKGILQNLTKDDFSIINVYFRNRYVHKYVQNVVYNWYELLSYFGGICGLMFGASIISTIEFLYFLTGKFFVLRFDKICKNDVDCKKNDITAYDFHNDVQLIHLEDMTELYWNEIVKPKKCIDMG